jgi:hypothetical protein
MKRLFGVGFAAVVNAIFIGLLAWSLAPIPQGEVHITDLSNGIESAF